jgi:PAS domain S-box-containing protein
MAFLKEQNIPRDNFISSVIIVFLLAIAFISTLTIVQYRYLSNEQKQFEKEYILSQKKNLIESVDNYINRFKMRKLSAQKISRARLMEKLNSAHAIATYIYQANKDQKTEKEIMSMIIDVLRIAWLPNGKKEYFILGFDGIIKLGCKDKKLEGHHYRDVFSPEKRVLFDVLKRIAMIKKEGFYKFNTVYSSKFSYVKQFSPLNCFFEMSENIEDVEDEVSREVLKVIGRTRQNNTLSGYSFLLKLNNMNGGEDCITMLMNPDLPELVGKKMSDSHKGAHGKEFVKEMLKGIRDDGEVFVKYWYKKPGTDTPSPKLTYWKLFPGWNWIVAKGVYLDDLDNIMAQKKAAGLLEIKSRLTFIIVICLLFVAGAIGLAYLFSRSIHRVFNSYETRQMQQKQDLIRFSMIIDQAHDGIAITDLEGKITYVNSFWAKMHGYESEEIIGLHKDVFHTAEQMKNEVIPYNKKIRVHGFNSGEVGHVHKDGTIIPTTMSSTLLTNDKNEPEGFLSIAVDISQIVMARNKAQEASQAKSTFLANMSHEIRTPMNGIIGMTRLALETSLTHEQHKLLKSVQVSANGLLGLINDILDFSKIEAGQLVMENNDFSLLAMLDNIRSMLFFDAETKGLALNIVNDAPDMPGFVKGDELRLRQILINIIGNGIKFTRKGSVTVRVFSENMPDNRVKFHFTVTDTGMGISPDKQKQIFDSFTQADTSTARQFGGTGLGLAITRQLVEMMEGKIRVDSILDQGTTFHFTIILARGEKKNIIRQHLNSESGLKDVTVLLVEDNEINRDLAQMVLTKEECQVITAENGLKALQILAKRQVDLILMDIQMPVMDGITATKMIRNFEKNKIKKDTFENIDIPDALIRNLFHRFSGNHLPIIAMTANAMAGDKEKCLTAGMDAYLTKPFKPEDVFIAINQFDF